MTITLTFNNKLYNKKFDIIVDSKQRILDTIVVLNDTLNFSVDIDKVFFVKSFIFKDTISVYNRYIDSKIFNGDILEIL